MTSVPSTSQAQLVKEDVVLFVCSTTGQGDEPDNMKVQSLKNISHPTNCTWCKVAHMPHMFTAYSKSL